MIALFYDPADGRILQCDISPRAWIEADIRPYVEVGEVRPDWEVTHRVENGELIPIG